MGHTAHDRAARGRTAATHLAATRRTAPPGFRLLGSVGLAVALVGAGTTGTAYAASAPAVPAPVPAQAPAEAPAPAQSAPSEAPAPVPAVPGATAAPSSAPVPAQPGVPPTPRPVPDCENLPTTIPREELAVLRQRCAAAVAGDDDSTLPVGGIDTGAGGTARTGAAFGTGGAGQAGDGSGPELALTSGGTGIGALAGLGVLASLAARRRRAR